jgi:hypothetical protein
MKAVDLYFLVNERLPIGLEDLTRKTRDWPEGFMPEIPLDSWGEPYYFEVLKGESPRYLLLSKGPDKALGTEDDVFPPKPGDPR